MSDPFCDDADFDLTRLPGYATRLLVEITAPARLVAHLRLVHDVAFRLIDALSQVWPDLQMDREAVLFGAAMHDVGKALHPDELYQPGAKHEIDGRRLLVAHGFEDRLARFAETHAIWKHGGDCTLEDLLVGFADTSWKGKRSEMLEDMVCSGMLTRIAGERWEVFARLDAIVEKIADRGDQRLAWQSRY